MIKITKISLLFLVFCISNSIYSQRFSWASSLSGGYVQEGFSGLATIEYGLNSKNYLHVGVQASFSNLKAEDDLSIPLNIYTVNVGYFIDVFLNDRRNLAIALGFGGVFGKEFINDSNTDLGFGRSILIDDQLLFGAFVGADLDLYVSQKIAINFKANQYYHASSDTGKLTPYFGLGFKFIISG